MQETKSYLKERWKTELKSLSEQVIHELKHKGDLTKLDSPKTTQGLIDLRGFSAPKHYTTEKSNSGRDKTYVSEGIAIKKMNFESIDFSNSNFERCEFFNCRFFKSNFNEARFVATNYWSCEFNTIEFIKTNFGQSTFQADGLIFNKLKNNFSDITFEQVNFSDVFAFDQTFRKSHFFSCKTGKLFLNKCTLNGIVFTGTAKDIFIKESRKVENVDFSKAIVSGLSLGKQGLNGFHFPDGDTYFKFTNKSKQLANLQLLTRCQRKKSKWWISLNLFGLKMILKTILLT